MLVSFQPAASLRRCRSSANRELRLPVCLPWRVQAGALQIAEIDESGPVRQAAHADNPWCAGLAQQRQQPGREREVAQIVRSELHLKSVDRDLPAGQGHDSRIANQEVKGLQGVHSPYEVCDRRQAGEIERFVADVGGGRFATDPIEGRLPLSIVAAGQNDLSTGCGQSYGRLMTEAARSAGNDGRSAE